MTNLQVLRKALELYCQWLNKHQHENKIMDSDYTPNHFLVYDKKRNLYGSYKVHSFPSSNCDRIVHAMITDGDEGGPTDLIIGWDDSRGVQFITQGFDLSWQLIYDANEGPKFHNEP